MKNILNFIILFSISFVARCQFEIPIYLTKQSHFIGPHEFKWPTHATIPLADGVISEGGLRFLRLKENGRFVPLQVECIAKWPSGKPKWIHVYFTGKYINGNPKKYKIVKENYDRVYTDSDFIKVFKNGIRLYTPSAPIPITSSEEIIIKNSRYNFVFNQSTGIQRVNFSYEARRTVVNVTPFLVNEVATMSTIESATIEQLGRMQVTLKIVGWFKGHNNVQKYKYVSRYVFYAKSSMIKISHATIFAEDMRNDTNAINSMGFRFSLGLPTSRFNYGLIDVRTNRLSNNVKTFPLFRGSVSVHQMKHDTLRTANEDLVWSETNKLVGGIEQILL